MPFTMEMPEISQSEAVNKDSHPQETFKRQLDFRQNWTAFQVEEPRNMCAAYSSLFFTSDLPLCDLTI